MKHYGRTAAYAPIQAIDQNTASSKLQLLSLPRARKSLITPLLRVFHMQWKHILVSHLAREYKTLHSHTIATGTVEYYFRKALSDRSARRCLSVSWADAEQLLSSRCQKEPETLGQL